MPRHVFLSWRISSYTGWGVLGLNLALQWARDPDISVVAVRSIRPPDIAVDAIAQFTLGPLFNASTTFAKRLAEKRGEFVTVDQPVLTPLEEPFVIEPGEHGETLAGQPTIGMTFIESTQLSPDAVKRAASFPMIIAGSTWNARALRAHGITGVETVLQGIDPNVFFPAPRRGLLSDRFVVFSGGKLERRKGQDIVLAAWRKFAARHPEALLLTCWQTFWPKLASSLDQSGLCAPVSFAPNGQVDVSRWLERCGIRADQHLDSGPVSNHAMPLLLREVDCAVFPNRCEGGTNLVAMECMACGVPTILSSNTGHLDLIRGDNVFPLEEQRPGRDREAGIGDIPGWGESSVDEVVDALERVYCDRAEAKRRGDTAARMMRDLTWRHTATRLKEFIVAKG